MPRVTRSNSIQEIKEEVVVSDEEAVDSKDDVSPAQKSVSNNKSKEISQFVMIAPGILKLIKSKLNFLYFLHFHISESLCKEDFRMVKLRHPKTDAGCLFAFSKGDKTVHEVNQFEEAKRFKVDYSLELYLLNYLCRSWFIDDSVQSEGSLFFTTFVDPPSSSSFHISLRFSII